MNTKAANERYQRQIIELSKQFGNAQCADCNGRYPRWASWNLGIFLCVNCAAIHRKMGTHISKVKSLTLDTWTKEQVERMREIGNVKNNLKYNPDERRNRPPANIEEGERNSDLERFIFDKYKGKFMDKNPPPVPIKDRGPRFTPSPSPVPPTPTSPADRSAANPPKRGETTLGIPSTWAQAKRSVSPAIESTTASTSTAPSSARIPLRSSSAAALLSHEASRNAVAAAAPPAIKTPIEETPEAPKSATIFDDLLALQDQPAAPNQQMNPWAHLAMQQQAVVSPMVMSHVTNGTTPAMYNNNGGNPMQLGMMAFSPPASAGYSPGVAFQPTGMQMSAGYAQSMGQQAFAGGLAAQQQQQFTRYGGGNPAFLQGQHSPNPFALQQQQQTMATQQISPQAYGAFAFQQQQPQQTLPSPSFFPQQGQMQQQRQGYQQQFNAWPQQQPQQQFY